MRKITIPILSTIIAGLILGPATNVSATINDQGTTWWSVPELLDYYTEVETERITTCGDDFECNMDFEMNHYENDEEYRAMQNILQGQIWVTAVNPAEETIKVLFLDEDMMLKRMGVNEHLELEYLYFGWFDEKNDQDYYHNYESLTGPAKGLRLLYVFNDTIGDPDVITPWQETELYVAGGNLIDNDTGKINYSAFAKYNMFNAHGSFNYSTCLQAEDYTYGAECRLMSSGDKGISYFPPRESNEIEDMPIIISDEDNTIDNGENIEAEPITETTDGNSEPITNDPTETLLSSDDVEGNDNHDDITEDGPSLEITNEAESITDNPIINNEPVVIPQTPETGTTTGGESSATELPWWLGAIIAINGLTLIWLFLPIRTKTPKSPTIKSTKIKHNQGTVPKTTLKSHFSTKKCQKTLDKNYQLR